MTVGTEFPRIIPEAGPASQNGQNVKRLVLCTGKVYYELTKERTGRGLESDVAITRVEQLCPFPFDLIRDEIQKYPNADLVWSQEEHKNQGFWPFMAPHVDCVLRHLNINKQLRLDQLISMSN